MRDEMKTNEFWFFIGVLLVLCVVLGWELSLAFGFEETRYKKLSSRNGTKATETRQCSDGQSARTVPVRNEASDFVLQRNSVQFLLYY